ncbi:MAG: CPBP family intramembrane metalloprotease [Rhodothermaceae bacterium]|nr:CPBP family intramembrane metalloprotease [Rhodothermaceae bacterium]
MHDSVNISLSIAIGAGTFCFLVYWFTAHSKGYERVLAKLIQPSHVDTYLPFFQKGLGVLLIGIIPGAIVWTFRPHFPGDYGIILDDVQSTTLWVCTVGVVLFCIPFFSARKDEMQAFYPQVRVSEWSVRLLALNALVWAVYLFAYEFLFRSFLLNSLLTSLDTVSAIVITTAISVSTHMPKGGIETFGTIPFSIMLCLAMIFTGSIWAGFIIHLVLALSNDYWALYFNPKMNLKRRFLLVNEN